MAHSPQSARPPGEARFVLSTKNLNKKLGPLGRNMLIIGAAVVAATGAWSLSIGQWWPIALGVLGWLVVVARHAARGWWTGPGKALGTLTVGSSGITMANPRGQANVFGWDQIQAVGVLSRKDTVAIRVVSPPAGIAPVKAELPVYPLISMMFIEAPADQVIAALRHYAGGRYLGVKLTPTDFTRTSLLWHNGRFRSLR